MSLLFTNLKRSPMSGCLHHSGELSQDQKSRQRIDEVTRLLYTGDETTRFQAVRKALQLQIAAIQFHEFVTSNILSRLFLCACFPTLSSTPSIEYSMHGYETRGVGRRKSDGLATLVLEIRSSLAQSCEKQSHDARTRRWALKFRLLRII